jgi:hypothetical protein
MSEFQFNTTNASESAGFNTADSLSGSTVKPDNANIDKHTQNIDFSNRQVRTIGIEVEAEAKAKFQFAAEVEIEIEREEIDLEHENSVDHKENSEKNTDTKYQQGTDNMRAMHLDKLEAEAIEYNDLITAIWISSAAQAPTFSLRKKDTKCNNVTSQTNRDLPQHKKKKKRRHSYKQFFILMFIGLCVLIYNHSVIVQLFSNDHLTSHVPGLKNALQWAQNNSGQKKVDLDARVAPSGGIEARAGYTAIQDDSTFDALDAAGRKNALQWARNNSGANAYLEGRAARGSNADAPLR